MSLSVFITLVMTAPSWGQGVNVEPLARYVPAEGLVVLWEHAGLDSQPVAWKNSATYQMLNQTSLGAMLEDILGQLIGSGLKTLPAPPVKVEEVVNLTKHLLQKGFAIGYCGSFNPPIPKAGVFVIRDAAKNPTFQAVLERIPQLNAPIAKSIEAAGDRKVWTLEGAPVRWWFEKDDFVVSFTQPGAADPVVSVLEGKSPSAVDFPTRVSLMTGESGYVPIGGLFIDLSSIPPLPPDAVRLGLDGIKAFQASWGIQGKATVIMVGVQAPMPRRGLLELLNLPPIGTATRFTPPNGVSDYAVMSINPAELANSILTLARQGNPGRAKFIEDFAVTFRERTGLSLRDDIAGKLGPRMAIFSPSSSVGFGNMFGMWFHPPDLGLVLELKDAKGFVPMLDRLMEVANRELKAAGALVPADQNLPARPGTEFAEFRKLKPPEIGYILAVPPSVLPFPPGFRPTVIVNPDRGVVALGGSPATARRVVGTLVLNGEKGEPLAGPDVVMVGQLDQSQTLPEALASIPALVQFFAYAAVQGNPNQGRLAGRPPLRLAIDPDTIPDVEALRAFVFPSRYTLTVDGDSARFTGYQAFPLPIPQLNGGMEAPVLVALLLPAVQAARDAARRSQCVNNLKQIGLAMHNYESVNDGFPARAICDKGGKPLLSWRVAILPYMDEQELYNKFKLDEPWDSPHNKALIPDMPRSYTCPSLPIGDATGLTPYQTFAPGGILELTRMRKVAEVLDGTSTTLMVVESESPVIWTKPEDIDLARNSASRMLGAGSKHPGGLNALMADGSVEFLPLTIMPQILKALTTPNGGEVISRDR